METKEITYGDIIELKVQGTEFAIRKNNGRMDYLMNEIVEVKPLSMPLRFFKYTSHDYPTNELKMLMSMPIDKRVYNNNFDKRNFAYLRVREVSEVDMNAGVGGSTQYDFILMPFVIIPTKEQQKRQKNIEDKLK